MFGSTATQGGGTDARSADALAATRLPTSEASTPAPAEEVESNPAAPERPRGRLLRLYPSLASPGFRLLFLGMMPAGLAYQMSVVVNGYTALTLSGSATSLGLVTLATGLPVMLLALVG